jgi:hypothetical protein
MNNILLYGIIIALTALCFGLGIWLFYLKFIVRPTREKYAFSALFALTSLVALAFTTAFYQTPWTAIMGLVAHYSGLPAPEINQPTWSEQVLIFLLVSWMAWLIQRTFSQWNGAISENQAGQQKRQEDVVFIAEGIKMLLGKYEEKELQIQIKQDYRNKISALEVPGDSLAWRIQAIELLSLRWHGYYRFETEDDENWHGKVDCWIGQNIKQKKVVAVFCCREEPSEKKIKNFIDYVCSLGNELSTCELLVIVQQGEDEKTYDFDNNIRVHQYSEAWLLDDLVNFEDYFLDLKKRVEFDCLPDSDLKLPDIYVPSTIRDESDQSIEADLETYLSNWLNEAGQRQLALLGEYGQGKSTGTLMFSHHIVQLHMGKPPRTPILLELRGKSPKTLQPLELLSVWASNYRIDPKAMMKLLQAGRLLLIFEGFDEMAEVSDSEARFSHFRSLWRFCYPKAKILITGRPNFFLDDHELKALLGISQTTATGAYVQALHLQPFSIPQITDSLRHTSEPNRQEICQLAQQDTKFYDIVARPSLLYIVGLLWDKELRARQQDVNSAIVIGLFIQHSYKRQTEKTRDGRDFMVLNEAERSYFMDGIAAFMAREKLPNQITLDKFNQIVEQLYSVIPDEVSLLGNVINAQTSKPLKQRLNDNDDPLETVKTDVRTCGILVKDLTRANALKFPHKSFFEYLFADYCVKRLVDKNNASAAAIWKVTKAKPTDLLYMLESLEFSGELLQQTAQIKSIIYEKEQLSKVLFKLLVNTNFFNGSFYQETRIIARLTRCFENNLMRRLETKNIALNIFSIFLFICVVYFIKHSMFFDQLNTFIISWINGIIQDYSILNYILIIAFCWFFILFNLTLQSRKDNRIPLWFILAVISRVSQKNMIAAYGKYVASQLPELAKEFGAQYILEKYHYNKDD